MKQILIGPNTRLEKYDRMSKEEIEILRANLANELYRCEAIECRVKLMIAAFGEGYKRICYFRAVNGHKFGCDWKKKVISHKPINLNDRKEVESLEKALSTLIKGNIKPASDSKEILVNSKLKIQPEIINSGSISSTTRRNVLLMPTQRDKFKENTKYKFIGKVFLRRHTSEKNKKTIYVNGIGVKGVSFTIREGVGEYEFQKLWDVSTSENNSSPIKFACAFLFEKFDKYFSENKTNDLQIEFWKTNSIIFEILQHEQENTWI